jgi:hypothetical protein
MVEPILLTMPRFEWNAAHRLAAKGDQNAIKALRHLFDEFKGQAISCFLCHRQLAEPYAQPLPDASVPSKIVITAICANCHDMPSALRVNKCLGLVRQMGFARKQQVYLDFNLQ